MSVATEITRIQNAKEDLKTSINAKNDSSHQITNETIDDYADFVDAIQTGGGTTPEKGVIFTEWDIDGYPTKCEIFGLSSIPNSYMVASSNSYHVYHRLKEIKLPSTVTSIANSFQYLQLLTTINLDNIVNLGTYSFFGDSRLETIGSLNNTMTTIPQYCFAGCSKLNINSLPSSLRTIESYAFQGCSSMELTSLPSNLTTIGTKAFSGCYKLTAPTIPDGVTNLTNNVFESCTSLKKISMSNVTQIIGNSGTAGVFYNCTGLKQVWIGSAITSTGLHRYSFRNCNSLEKIYIDLPRATVEAFTNYQYAFMNDTSKTGIIVCNDDSGFINKATFDAQVIS